MKILFVSRRFDSVMGGVERMAITLMNEMVQRGHKIDLLTWDQSESAQTFFPLDKSIQWHKLSLGNPLIAAGIGLRLKRFIKIRSFLKQIRPDVILTFQEGAYFTISICGLGLFIPTICAVRESPLRYRFIKARPSFRLTCNLFRIAAAVTLQFERYKEAYPDYLQHKLKFIGNHIFPAEKFADTEGGDMKRILSAGRLSPEKNHQVLISAFSKISPDFPDWTLTIIGQGNEKEKLESQISSLPENIRTRIDLAGAQKNVPEWLQASQIYCQPSKWEGFPNSVAEAMAHGLPVVGFRECDGVSDLVQDTKTGFLADGLDDENSLAEKLRLLMEDTNLRKEQGKRAVEYTRQFDPKSIFDIWETLFKKVSRS